MTGKLWGRKWLYSVISGNHAEKSCGVKRSTTNKQTKKKKNWEKACLNQGESERAKEEEIGYLLLSSLLFFSPQDNKIE